MCVSALLITQVARRQDNWVPIFMTHLPHLGGKKTFKFQCVHPPLPSFPLPSSLSPFPSPSSWLLQWWTAQQWKPGYGNRWGIQCDPTLYILSFSPPSWILLGTNGSNFLKGSGSNSICHIAVENKCGLLAHFNFWPGKFKEKRFVQFTSYSKVRKQL